MCKNIFEKQTIKISAILSIFSLIGLNGMSNAMLMDSGYSQNSNKPIIEIVFSEGEDSYPAIEKSYFYFPIPANISESIVSLKNKLNENSTIKDNIVWWSENFFHIR